MLTTRSTKRDNANRFSRDMLFDIFDDDRPVGTLVFEKANLTATITLGGRIWTVAHDSSQDIDRLGPALIRVITGRPKQEAHPWVLKDGDGQIQALGQLDGKEFAVRRGEEGFFLRAPGRPNHPYPQDSDRSLGSVGQEKFFTTTLSMRLPPEFDAAFQVFLLTLVLGLTMIRLDNSTGTST